MLKLIRQDPAFQGLSSWLSITAGVGTALLGSLSVLTYVAATQGRLPDPGSYFIMAFAITWLAMAVFLLSPGARDRASDFTLGLPLEARWIWTLHHVAVFLSAMTAWALLTGILLIGNRVARGFGAPEILSGEYALDFLVYLPAGFTLVVALLQTPVPEQRTLPLRRIYTGLWLLTVFGALILTLLLTRLPVGFALLLPLSSIAVLLWNRRRSPDTFLVAPRDATRGGGSRRCRHQDCLGLSPALGIRALVSLVSPKNYSPHHNEEVGTPHPWVSSHARLRGGTVRGVRGQDE